MGKGEISLKFASFHNFNIFFFQPPISPHFSSSLSFFFAMNGISASIRSNWRRKVRKSRVNISRDNSMLIHLEDDAASIIIFNNKMQNTCRIHKHSFFSVFCFRMSRKSHSFRSVYRRTSEWMEWKWIPMFTMSRASSIFALMLALSRAGRATTEKSESLAHSHFPLAFIKSD